MVHLRGAGSHGAHAVPAAPLSCLQSTPSREGGSVSGDRPPRPRRQGSFSNMSAYENIPRRPSSISGRSDTGSEVRPRGFARERPRAASLPAGALPAGCTRSVCRPPVCPCLPDLAVRPSLALHAILPASPSPPSLRARAPPPPPPPVQPARKRMQTSGRWAPWRRHRRRCAPPAPAWCPHSSLTVRHMRPPAPTPS